MSGFGYDELLEFLKEHILIGEGTQQFLPLFAVLDCLPAARQSTVEFKDKFCGLAARVSAPISSGGMGPTIPTKVLLTVLAVWRMQKLPEFASFLQSVAKFNLNDPATYDKMMANFDAQQPLVHTKVIIAAGAPKEPRPERPFQREPKPREKGKAFAAQGQDRVGWDPCTICGSPKHGVDFCFGPGGGREDKEKFLKSIQDRQRHFDSVALRPRSEIWYVILTTFRRWTHRAVVVRLVLRRKQSELLSLTKRRVELPSLESDCILTTKKSALLPGGGTIFG